MGSTGLWFYGFFLLFGSVQWRLGHKKRRIGESNFWAFFLRQKGNVYVNKIGRSEIFQRGGISFCNTVIFFCNKRQRLYQHPGVFSIFLLRKGAEGLTKVLRIFRSKGVSWGKGSTGQRRQGSVWFKDITGGVQDFSEELRY